MPLESASYINGLVSSNPAGTDSEGQGDDHLRLIKATLLATFPNLTGPMTATQATLNMLTPSNGALRFNGAVPVGSMHAFPLDPGSTLVARGATAAGTEQYIECDGSVYPTSKFPDLAASGMVVVSAPNFTMPLLTDTGRFLRSRIPGTTSAGVSQANQNLAHTHVNTLTDAGHTHTVTDPGHVHAITDPSHHHTTSQGNAGAGNSPSVGAANATGTINESPVTSNSTTGITINSGTTGITNASNTTGVTITNVASGASEARPESFSVLWCLKT
jgi:hypothetical protein